MVTCLAYCVDKELRKAIEYLKEQVRVLKEQQEKYTHAKRHRLFDCARYSHFVASESERR